VAVVFKSEREAKFEKARNGKKFLDDDRLGQIYVEI